MKNKPAKIRFTTRKKQGARMIPVDFQKAQYIAPVCSYNTLVRLAEQTKWHGPLPLVHAIMSTRLVSNNSAYWPIFGLNTCVALPATPKKKEKKL